MNIFIFLPHACLTLALTTHDNDGHNNNNNNDDDNDKKNDVNGCF